MIGDARTSIVNTALFDLGQEPVADLSDASLQYSSAAIKLLRVIETSRDVVLARHGWTCALEYADLVPATIANYVAPDAYPSVFLLPGGALRVWSVEGSCTTSGVWQGWEPRWQVGSTEADGSPRLILRGAPQLLGDGLDGAWMGYDFGAGWSSAPSAQGTIPNPLNPTPTPTPAPTPLALTSVSVAYVRRADWGSLDPHVTDAIAHHLAARACYSITGDQSRGKDLMGGAEQAIQLAISSEANQEGGQPPLGASIPMALRNYGRG